MNKINVNTINTNSHKLEYKSNESAGVDLRANIQEKIKLKKGNIVAIPTGVYIELEKGYEAQVRPRSGLSLNHGITVINSPGTIDSDYRGEIKVPIINLGEFDYVIHPNDRIAQLVFSPIVRATFNYVTKLNQTERGEGGFGSTGIK